MESQNKQVRTEHTKETQK